MHLFITKSLGKEYHSSWNSCACLCALVAWMMILLIPFLVGYYTDGFYLNNVVLYDQPSFIFNNQFVIYTYSNGVPSIYTNIPNMDNALPEVNLMDASIIQQDYNFDDKIDYFQLTAHILGDTTLYSMIYVVVPFTVWLQQAKINTTSLVIIEINTPDGSSHIQSHTYLKLVQGSSLASKNYYQFINTGDILLQNSYDLVSIIQNQFENSIQFLPKTQNFVTPGSPLQTLTLEVNLYLDQLQKIVVKPTILTIIKFAFIQYLALFIPIYYIGKEIIIFIFKFRFIHTMVKKQGVSKFKNE